jgi:hypothetical protein
MKQREMVNPTGTHWITVKLFCLSWHGNYPLLNFPSTKIELYFSTEAAIALRWFTLD